MSCTISTKATCLMQLASYVYDELQVVITIKVCNCKQNCETPIFLILLEHDDLKA